MAEKIVDISGNMEGQVFVIDADMTQEMQQTTVNVTSAALEGYNMEKDLQPASKRSSIRYITQHGTASLAATSVHMSLTNRCILYISSCAESMCICSSLASNQLVRRIMEVWFHSKKTGIHEAKSNSIWWFS